MATSIGFWGITLALVTGCSGTLGLANATAYGGNSPETRVHDVIASGHDSCERSAFPQGDVLRGHTPACASGDSLAEVTLLRQPAPASVRVTPWHGFGVCVDSGSGRARAEEDPVGVSPMTPPTVVCTR